ncbi:50S ribosomal protein L6 [Nosocomiicoccus ampullae]|uniref:Large ribosomal subunit protein uL6 n=1 Tax=Nosocomiicoccus ampullae TaxID=489910 RepID=A0A9Q2CYG4_9STAP|nr:50S ribosomal protein L6 [Nosocomiicoccus ampullae]MBB5175580.1 large subunit ribosomal protein L6 [Nosocomiicoccus ampullae]QYA46981.1 50S ribosomal protein L6 [Nosocomiicoccus ampullae]QYA48597.1 50S ribosomal protein L6 [Nosocomiicoccus ampullae]HJB78695.1 50S ribosomal protein L6 [Candidatus Nosocomiicoccus stercorigallinarum]
MSRIGNRIIEIPSNVTVDVDGTTFTVKGPKGELTRTLNADLNYKIEENTIVVERPNDSIPMRSIHGTTRSLLNNMIQGVSEGFTKELELIGVGYRAQMQGNKLVLNVGLSHPVEFESTDTLSIAVDGNTNLKIEGINKEEVGALASNIRAVRPPEPYKGKGIRYKDEYVRRKEGKTGK